MTIEIDMNNRFTADEVIELYKANGWSAAEKPELLMKALRNSDSTVTARISGMLVGIGNAISDGYLVVYYPHLLVHPDYQGKGIGQKMMLQLQERYRDFHQQMLTADGKAVPFYEKMGFERAGQTVPMWVYAGKDH